MLEKIRSKLPKTTRRRIILVGIIITIILGIRYLQTRNGVLKLDFVEAKKGSVIESINASGEITAHESIALSFQGSGRISWIGVSEGQKVNKYQALAQLDTTSLNASYQSARASLRAAEASVENVHDQLKDNDDDETFAQKDTRTAAEAAKDQAYEAVIAAKKALDNATLISPFEGIVTNLDNNIVPGANVLYTTSIMSVVNPETIYFESEVNETEVIKLRVGQKATVNLDAYPDQEFEGIIDHIDFISTTTSTGGTAYKVNITLPQSSNTNFRLGMGGDADFVLNSKEDVLVAPITAIVDQDDKEYVWIAENGKAKRVEVQTGISSINEIEIISGLSEGQTIIKRPPAEIEEGKPVKSS